MYGYLYNFTGNFSLHAVKLLKIGLFWPIRVHCCRLGLLIFQVGEFIRHLYLHVGI